MSEQDNEVLEATNSNDEGIEINLEGESDDTEALKAQIAEKETFARQAIARAKKAEAELKALKSKEVAPDNQKLNNTISQETIEETVLKAQGESQEMIDQLKKIAQVTGKSIFDARQDPIFLAIKQTKENEVKSSQAKLGASKGSGSKKAEKTFNTPGLTAEEHKALWKEKMGR
jgi:hypothetical protein